MQDINCLKWHSMRTTQKKTFYSVYSIVPVILSLLSALLIIMGVKLQVQSSIFIGLSLLAIIYSVLVFFSNKIKCSLIIFIITLTSLTISLSYELVSNYPLGEDVHAEYRVIKESLNAGSFNPLNRSGGYVPQYYYEIFSFILNSVFLSNVTGLTVIEVIKFVWNSLIIGLIAIVVFIYSQKLSNIKLSALIGCLLIFAQSTYITTLHSTSKQATALFILVIIALLLLKFLENNGSKRSTSLALILLTLGFSGCHYLVSGIFVALSVLALAVLTFIQPFLRTSTQPVNSTFKPVNLILILTVMWLLWYFLLTGSIIRPVVDFVEGLFLLQKKPYSYELINIALPTYLNYLRLTINGITAITILLAGLNAFINLLKRTGNFLDSLIVNASFLFLILSISEIMGYSTLGVGRLSIIFMVIVSPYFYNAFNTVFSRILMRRKHLILLFLVFVLNIRLLLSTGVLPYATGSVENGVFLDPTYKFEASISDSDLKSVYFISKYISKATICADFKAENVFYYVHDLGSMVLIGQYFTNNADNICITYFNSFNLVRTKVVLRIGEFSNVTEFLEACMLKLRIYDNRYALAFY